ncbi:hypothetical protein, partial [Kitasatospora sp. NPDC057500]|uniref:hypothetical protein n=1 Tax=Kitasatospora sp. NPDC057500 TaxID=3346151 RepID=UPI00368F2839
MAPPLFGVVPVWPAGDGEPGDRHARALAQFGDGPGDDFADPAGLQRRAVGLGLGVGQVLGDHVGELRDAALEVDDCPPGQPRAVPRVG